MPWCGYCGRGWNMPYGPQCGCAEAVAKEEARKEQEFKEKVRAIALEVLSESQGEKES